MVSSSLNVKSLFTTEVQEPLMLQQGQVYQQWFVPFFWINLIMRADWITVVSELAWNKCRRWVLKTLQMQSFNVSIRLQSKKRQKKLPTLWNKKMHQDVWLKSSMSTWRNTLLQGIIWNWRESWIEAKLVAVLVAWLTIFSQQSRTRDENTRHRRGHPACCRGPGSWVFLQFLQADRFFGRRW